MVTASTIRLQIEAALALRIPSALTPAPKMIRPVASTGIEPLDEILEGGLPIGAISELVGPECSGRTSLALSFVSRITQTSKVCAWIDVSNSLDPASAAVNGVDLARLLWVRCGVIPKTGEVPTHSFAVPEKFLLTPPAKKGLHGGGFGPHPRTETKGLSQAVNELLKGEAIKPQHGGQESYSRLKNKGSGASLGQPATEPIAKPMAGLVSTRKPWNRMEQALRATDLLLQGGGFSAIVLDIGSLSPEAVSRVPLATWYRYRAAAERTQSSILLLTQHPSAKSSAELMVKLQPAKAIRDESTVFCGIEPRVEVSRRRFTETPTNVIPMRKPPQSVNVAYWQSRTVWSGRQ